MLETESQLAGVVSGLDQRISHTTHLGFFLGGPWGDLDLELNTQKAESDSFYVGLYGQTIRGLWKVDSAVTIGWSDHETSREAANNLTPKGLQRAKANFDSIFVSPEVTITRVLWSGLVRVEPNINLRYAGLFQESYQEQGAADALQLNERDIHLLQAPAQIALPYDHDHANGALTSARIHIGLQGRTSVGGENVNAVLLGQTIAFDPGNQTTLSGIYGGGTLSHTTPRSLTLTANVEGLAETNDSVQVTARTAVKITF